MYGLPQAGKLANTQLQTFLEPHGYHPCPITPGLWMHDTRPIHFTLVVDDFAVRYTDKADANHLMSALHQHYQVTEDWEATRYCGMALKWDYQKWTVDLSMPGYIDWALKHFQHPQPRRPEHVPHVWQKPTYGAKTQFVPEPDATPALDAADCKCVQEVIGMLLYYARAVDATMLIALGTLAMQQAKGTKATMEALTQLLNYCATHLHAIIQYQASNMVLWTHSDASYLTAPKGRSRTAGYCFLSSWPTKPPTATDEPPPDNGPVHVLCQIMKQVVASAAEAELGVLFLNAQAICPFRIALEELGHLQPAMPLQTDNSMASGIANDTIKQKQSKAIDMRFYWIRDCICQGQFHIFWSPRNSNRADYFTAHNLVSSLVATLFLSICMTCSKSASLCLNRCVMALWNSLLFSPEMSLYIYPFLVHKCM